MRGEFSFARCCCFFGLVARGKRETRTRARHAIRPTSPSPSSPSLSSQDRTTFEAVATDHMRLSGVYWGLAALDALDRLDALADQADALAAFVAGCARPGGGYGGAERQDPHLTASS